MTEPHPRVLRAVVGPPASGVTHALRSIPGSFVGAGLERPTPIAFAPLVIALGRPLPPSDPIGSIVAQVGDGVLVVDDAHLADDETIELLAALAERVSVVVGVHPSPGRPAEVLAHLAPGSVDRPPIGDDDAIRDLLTVSGAPPATIDAAVALAGGAIGVAVVLAQGDRAGRDLHGEYRSIVSQLDDGSVRWLAAQALAPTGFDRAALGPPPTDLTAWSLVDGSSVPRPALVARLAADRCGDEVRREIVRDVATRADDPIVRAEALRSIGAIDAAVAVARAAVVSESSPDRRATLAALAANDRATSFAAADQLLARERPTEAARLVAGLDPCDAPETATIARMLRQLGDSAGLDVARRLPVDHPERRRGERALDEWLTAEPGQPRREIADPAEADDLDAARWSWHLELVAAAERGDPAAPVVSAGEALGERTDVPAAWRQLGRHVAALRTFHVDGARAALIDDLAVADRPALAGAVLDSHRVLVHADLGSASDARGLLAIPADRAGDDARAMWAWAEAEAELAAGRPVSARRAAAAVDDLETAPAWLARLAAGWAAVDLGEPVEAPRRRRDSVVAAVVERELAALAALSTDPATAATELDESADAWSPCHRRAALRSRWGAGEAWRRAGDLDRAIAALRDVEGVCLTAGYGPILQRARRSLRLAGVRTVGARRTGTSGPLSARETEVLRLVGKGLSTRDIAVRLGISTSTVETQVTTAMQKLGARTRLQAAAMVREAGR